jgi:hypothetical protein
MLRDVITCLAATYGQDEHSVLTAQLALDRKSMRAAGGWRSRRGARRPRTEQSSDYLGPMGPRADAARQL